MFLGHGSPMNAIEDNEFSREWVSLGKSMQKPKAILCISAHWETWGTMVTSMEKPRTIHDFGGFPDELYEVQYPAPGSRWLADELKKTIKKIEVRCDTEWGLDHGCWSVVSRLFPKADVPVVQLSLDSTQPAQSHFELGKELAPLREKGVLIIGSGNIVHNLRLVRLKDDSGDFNIPYAFDWALEASKKIKELVDVGDYQSLTDYQSLGKSVCLAVPTPEHYLPLLYVLALKRGDEKFTYFNDKHVAGSLTMTCLKSI